MSDFVLMTIQHQVGGVLHMQSWEISKDNASDLMNTYGPPDAYTKIPVEVTRNVRGSIMGGEWTEFKEGIE